MPTTFQTVTEHFKKNAWKFQVVEGHPILNASFRASNGTFRLVVGVDEADDLIQVFGFVPVVVPPHKLAAVSELCVRLSQNMRMGRFELNHSDGELRCQTYSAYRPGELKAEVIQRVVGANLTLTDQNFPAFIAVIYANVPPAEAAEQIRSRIAKGQPTGPQPEAQAPSRIILN